MPAIDNPKMEAFAQHRAAGHTQLESYRLAGYLNPTDPVASRLSRNAKVAARLKELQAQTAEKFEITVESITRELDDAIKFAIECNSPSARVAAVLGKAKLGGLMVERVSVSHNYALMSEAELRLELAALVAEARSLRPGVSH
jgi:hypothetical protein